MKTNPNMRSTGIGFGKYHDKSLEEIYDLNISYLQFLAKPRYSGKFYENSRSTELNWRVPWVVRIAARELLFSRGWKLLGERFEK